MAEFLTPKKRDDLAGKSFKEVLDALSSEGVKLDEDQLDSVAGGGDFDWGFIVCPGCGMTVYVYKPKTDYICNDCGRELHVKW